MLHITMFERHDDSVGYRFSVFDLILLSILLMLFFFTDLANEIARHGKKLVKNIIILPSNLMCDLYL